MRAFFLDRQQTRQATRRSRERLKLTIDLEATESLAKIDALNAAMRAPRITVKSGA